MRHAACGLSHELELGELESLRRIAFHEALAVVHVPMLAEEVVDRLIRLDLGGVLPDRAASLRAWVAVVSRNASVDVVRSPAIRCRSFGYDDLDELPAQERDALSLDSLLDRLGIELELTLTDVEMRTLELARTQSKMCEIYTELGVDGCTVRRTLRRIARKIRELLRDGLP